MINDLMSNPIIWCISSLCTVGGFVLAIVAMKINKKEKQLSFYSRRNEIISSGKSYIPQLKILYDNMEVLNLSSTIVIIWNSGNQIIKKEDLVQKYPLTISCGKAGKILDATIINESEAANSFSICEKNEEMIVLDFDYVEPGDGLVIQVLQTGNNKLSCDMKIKGGRIKDAGSLPEKALDKHDKTIFRVLAMFMIIVSIYCIMELCATWDICGFYEKYVQIMTMRLNPTIEKLASVVTIILLLSGYRMLYVIWKRLFEIGIPDNLKRIVNDKE